MTYIERSARTVGAVSRSFLSARFSVGRRSGALYCNRAISCVIFKINKENSESFIRSNLLFCHFTAEVAVRRPVRNSYIIFIYLFFFCNFKYAWSLSPPPTNPRLKHVHASRYSVQLLYTQMSLKWSVQSK